MMDRDHAYSAAYPIELLARRLIILDEPALQRSLEKRLGRIATPKEPSDKVRLYFLEDYPVKFKEGSLPAQLALLGPSHGDAQQQLTDLAKEALQQSWEFRGAADIYKDCHHSLLLANMMSSPLSHEIRRKIIINGLLALLDSSSCDLVYWAPTQQMLSPTDILSRYSEPRELINPVYGFLNVRFFNIASSDGNMIMDTLGLAALGLTDLQVHYHTLDPNKVSHILYNLGAYLFERGDVIEDGHTIQGPDNSRWTCRREVSLLEPKREILDINPGPEFAAGNRP
jgi:Domain of unknown function (DUF4261)